MIRRRLVLPSTAVVGAGLAALMVGPPRLDSAMPWLAGQSGPPSPGAVAGAVAWCTVLVVSLLGLIDLWHALRHRRLGTLLTLPRLLFATGALILAVGCVAQLSSYRVCCAPHGIVGGR